MPQTDLTRFQWKLFPLRIALFCCIAGALSVATCLAATPVAHGRLTKLYDYWRWKQYWDDTTELGTLYAAGRQFHALLFWRTDDMPPSLGFCSTELGVCQFYPDLGHSASNTQMKTSMGEDPLSAFRRFLAGSFDQKLFPLAHLPEPKEGDFSVESTDIVLPTLDPPDPIKGRKVRPVAETEALVANLGCPPDLPACKLHLMIPFYSENDVWIPVYRECLNCDYRRPVIIFMRYIQGHWWHGAMDSNNNSEFVDRTRGKIEKALMVEVRR